MVKMQFEEKKVQTQKVLAPDLPPVMVDEHQMHQVFLNLILNALHATEEEDTVKITTRFFHEDNQVEIIFADTGMGIPEKNLKKVFNPFFTTKQGGTGLGLSVVSKIIMNHNGKIFLRSEEGKGALFTIILPAAEKFEKVGS